MSSAHSARRKGTTAQYATEADLNSNQANLINTRLSTSYRTEEEEEEDDFLGHIFNLEDNDLVSRKILIDNQPHIFKLDTGASVSVAG